MKTSVKRPTDLPDVHRAGLIFLLILIVGTALRVAKLVTMPLVAPDAVLYISQTMAIGADGVRSLFVNGLGGTFSVYPIFIYLVNLGVGNPILSGQLVSLLFGCLLIVMSYLLAKQVLGPRVGLFAAFLIAMHPHLIRYSAEVLKDSMLFFFATASVVLALRGHEKKNRLVIVLAGVVAWATSFVRIYGIVIVAAISVAIVVTGLMERRAWRAIAGELLLFAVPAPVAGYLLFILFVGTGNEFIFRSLTNLFVSVIEPARSVASYRDILIANNPGVDRQYLDVITSYPRLSAAAEFINVFSTAFSGVILAFFLAGIYLDRSSLIKDGPRLFVLSCAGIVIVIDVLILMTVFFLSKRHALIAVILLVPWSAVALDRFIQWYRERASKKYSVKAVTFNRLAAAVLVVWVALALAFTTFWDKADTKHRYKREAAEYIKGLGIADPLIMVRPSDRLIPLYAGGHELVLNDNALLENTVVERRPDFIIWDTNEGELPDSIERLSDGGVIKPIKTVAGHHNAKILIYGIQKN